MTSLNTTGYHLNKQLKVRVPHIAYIQILRKGKYSKIYINEWHDSKAVLLKQTICK